MKTAYSIIIGLFSAHAMILPTPATLEQMKGFDFYNRRNNHVNSHLKKTCGENFTKSCQLITEMICAAEKHHIQREQVLSLEREISKERKNNEKADRSVSLAILNDRKTAYPNHDKQFIETVDATQKEQLFEAIKSILQDLSPADILAEERWLTKVLSD